MRFTLFGFEIRLRSRPHVWKWDPMTEAQLLEVVAGWDDARLHAVFQILQQEIDSAVDAVGEPRIATRHGALAHAAGGLEHLRLFQDALLGAIGEADAQLRRRQAEAEARKKREVEEEAREAEAAKSEAS